MNKNRIKIFLFIPVLLLVFYLSFSERVKAAENLDNFVANLYQDIQGRDPDPDGERYWVNLLSTQKINAADVAKQFLFSPEFLNKNVSNDQYVTILYKALQNRTPDNDGKEYWISLLNNGYSRLRILDGIIKSQEFKNKCMEYGISPGSIEIINPIDTNPQLVSFMTRLYRDIQNREPDSQGLEYYVNLLASHKLNAADTVKIFILSDEFKNRNLSDSEYVFTLYKALQNRNPDESGFQYWIDQLNNSHSRLNVLSKIIASQEFTKLCTSYNIYSGTIELTDPIDKYPEVIPFVNRLYNVFLNRTPEQDGLRYYVELLGEKKISAAQFADMLIFSDEYKSKYVNENDYIINLYNGLLNRQPDSDGYDRWLKDLRNGYSRRYILSCLVNSNEFLKQCQLYGVIQGYIENPNIRTIVIDAGHNYGGDDGANATFGNITYYERYLNMFMALKLRTELENQGFNVIFTREASDASKDDLQTSLQKRVDIANKANADLFISLHHDKSSDSTTTGISVHYSTYKPGLDKSGVISNGEDPNGWYHGVNIDTTPCGKAIISRDLAYKLADGLSSSLGYTNRLAHDHNLFVTVNTNMPAILIENGFISNEAEAKRCADPNQQALKAQAIAKIINDYFSSLS